MISDQNRLIDSAAWLSGGIALFSFWQGIALAVTIVAGLLSISLALLRWHDRIRYGPKRGEQ